MKLNKNYDPAWLVELAEKQYPDETWLAESLNQCTKYHKESKAYYHFVNSENANKPGSEWQFKTNYILEDEEKGEIVLDILKNLRIGGIEFIKEITGDPHYLAKCEKNPIYID